MTKPKSTRFKVAFSIWILSMLAAFWANHMGNNVSEMAQAALEMARVTNTASEEALAAYNATAASYYVGVSIFWALQILVGLSGSVIALVLIATVRADDSNRGTS